MTKTLNIFLDLSDPDTFSALMNLLGDGFVISDREGKIRHANRDFMDFLHLSRDQVEVVRIADLIDSFSPPGTQGWGKIEQTLERGRPCRNFVIELTLDGTPAVFRVSAIRFFSKKDDPNPHTLSIWQKVNLDFDHESLLKQDFSQEDIGKLPINEHELSENWHELEELIRQHTAELRIQNIKLEKEISERKHAEIAEREHRALAEALGNTAAILNRTPDLDVVLDNILLNLEKVVPHDSANVMLINDEGIAKVVRYKGSSLHSGSIRPPVFAFFVDATPTLKTMRDTLKPLVIAEVDKDPGWISQIGSSWIQSYLAAPLFFGDQILGYLNLVSSQKDFYNNMYAEHLLAFASHASIAIRNAQLFDQVREYAASEERQRLAREMHDAVSQTLFTASVVAETLPLHWERSPEKGMEGLEKLQRLTKGALAEMRAILLELRPEALANADLGDLIEQLAQGAKSYMEVTLSTDIKGKYPLPEHVHIAIYRIAQEIFNNIVKHARATHVHIGYENMDGYVYLSITDNGRGFNTAHLRDDRLGLKIMQERADSIGASLEIMSDLDGGTNITLVWQEG